MKIEQIGFYAYCAQCNTQITDIKYEELEEETGEKWVDKEFSYDKKKVICHYLYCPVCGEKLETHPHKLKTNKN